MSRLVAILTLVVLIALRLVFLVLLLPVRLLFPSLFRRFPRVMNLPADDPGMRQAVEQARQTLPEFIARLGSPPPGQTGAAVKVSFPVEGGTEHVWISNVRYENGTFIGTVDNDTISPLVPREGSEVRVPAGQITDWNAIENGHLIGGYTVRYLRSRMSPRERAAFDATLSGLIVDEPPATAA